MTWLVHWIYVLLMVQLFNNIPIYSPQHQFMIQLSASDYPAFSLGQVFSQHNF